MSVSALGIVLFQCAASAQAPDYPNKPIRIITHSPAGASPDVVARIWGERLSAALGQKIVVDNRPDGAGAIAMGAVAKAAPDGYTLGTMTFSHAVDPAIVAQLPYDTARDLAPVRQTTQGSLMLAVNADSPHRSIAALVASAKAQPAHLAYASSGNAAPTHLFAEVFKARTGTDIRHILYKGGVAATTALLGNQVEILSTSGAAVIAQIRAGKIRPLATGSPERMPALPDVPTLAEFGYTGFDVRDWQGLVVPAKTPKAIIDRLSAEMTKALEQPEVKDRFATLGVETVGTSNPEAFGALIQAELTRWAKVVRDSGVRAD
ncbi:MAG: tripartite tricarboxylate transporter substrate binding protein [Betaproteobacteria bacterium]|nr:tripartite tricarboxylate transporter substrate binding protein [Betaproteobacteria bacterium]